MADGRGCLMTAGRLLRCPVRCRHQPRPGCVATGVVVAGLAGFCSRECSRVSLYAACIARGRHWFGESPAQRGGSVGVSSQTFQERRDQFHVLRLGNSLDPFNPAVTSFLGQAQATFLRQTGDPVAAQQLASQALEILRQQQASSLAYFDTFWMMAALTFVVAFAVLFVERRWPRKAVTRARNDRLSPTRLRTMRGRRWLVPASAAKADMLAVSIGFARLPCQVVRSVAGAANIPPSLSCPDRAADQGAIFHRQTLPPYRLENEVGGTGCDHATLQVPRSQSGQRIVLPSGTLHRGRQACSYLRANLDEANCRRGASGQRR